MPAQLTSVSIPPSRLAASAIASRTWDRSVTSAGRTSPSGRASMPTTRAPSASRSSLAAAPIAPDAPVRTIRMPVSRCLLTNGQQRTRLVDLRSTGLCYSGRRDGVRPAEARRPSGPAPVAGDPDVQRAPLRRLLHGRPRTRGEGLEGPALPLLPEQARALHGGPAGGGGGDDGDRRERPGAAPGRAPGDRGGRVPDVRPGARRRLPGAPARRDRDGPRGGRGRRGGQGGDPGPRA